MSIIRVEWETWPPMVDGTQDDPLCSHKIVDSTQEAMKLAISLEKRLGVGAASSKACHSDFRRLDDNNFNRSGNFWTLAASILRSGIFTGVCTNADLPWRPWICKYLLLEPSTPALAWATYGAVPYQPLVRHIQNRAGSAAGTKVGSEF